MKVAVYLQQKKTLIKQSLGLGIAMIAVLSACEYKVLEPPVDCNSTGPTIGIVATTDANCGLSNGTVELSATGTGTLSFSLAGSNQTAGNFTGLAAGNYTATVQDANGCTDQISVSIANADGVSITSVEVEDASCDSNTGKITITATGGVTPYAYSIDGSSFQVSNVFSNLSTGTKSITVKDASDCEFTQSATIGSGVSFSATIAPIIQNNCAVSGCHNGSRFPNLSTFEGIKNNASNIRARTSNRSMPQGGSLTQQQIDNIACWVEDGALNN